MLCYKYRIKEVCLLLSMSLLFFFTPAVQYGNVAEKMREGALGLQFDELCNTAKLDLNAFHRCGL